MAERQFGVVGHEQLLELGIGARAIGRRVGAGSLHPIHVGVYAVGHRFLSRKGHWMAAVLAAGPGALLSHRDGGALLAIRRSEHREIDVSVVGRSRRSRPGVRIHRPRELLPQDRISAHGIPCTSVPRTLLDLAEILNDRQLERTCDEAELLRVLDLRAVKEMLGRAGGHRGAHRLRRVLAIHDIGSTFTRSDLEEAMLGLVDEAGLPRPRVNAWIPLPVAAGGTEVDFLWAGAWLVVEVDGADVHRRRRTWERDYDKNLLLDSAGFTVKRFTWRQVSTDGDRVIASIKRHLELRGAI